MADIPLDANVLGPDAPTAIAVCEAAPEDRVEAIRKKGAHIIVAGKTHVELPLLLKILKEKFGVNKLMIEGGPTLNWHMLHDRLVDEITAYSPAIHCRRFRHSIACRRNAYQYRR